MSREELDLATGPDDAVSTKRSKKSLPEPSFYQTTFAKTKLSKYRLPNHICQNHICQNHLLKMTFEETKFSQITNVKMASRKIFNCRKKFKFNLEWWHFRWNWFALSFSNEWYDIMFGFMIWRTYFVLLQCGIAEVLERHINDTLTLNCKADIG